MVATTTANGLPGPAWVAKSSVGTHPWMTAPIPTPRITHFQTRPTMSVVSSRAASTRSRSVGVRPSAWRAATGVVNTKGSTHWSSLKRDRTNPIRIAAPSPAATHATMMSIPNVSASITTAEERGQYEGDAERDPRTQEADEQRDRTAGTERSDRAGGAAGQVQTEPIHEQNVPRHLVESEQGHPRRRGGEETEDQAAVRGARGRGVGDAGSRGDHRPPGSAARICSSASSARA